MSLDFNTPPGLGLTSREAADRLKRFGKNDVSESRKSNAKKLLSWLLSPITLMLAAAAGLSFFADKAFDGYFIIGLMLLNVAVGFWHEYKADDAVERLKEHLALKVRVVRGGRLQELDAKLLVPGDLIKLEGGDIVPADVQIGAAANLSADESALTGESFPKEKRSGDACYAGSFIATGTAFAEVTATGAKTNYGKILVTVERASKRSLLERDILGVTKFLLALSLGAVLVLSLVFLARHKALVDWLTLDLSLVIAGIPVSLPTVMTLIISFGILRLAKRQVVVRKVASLENLANVNLLLTDKTGTLTQARVALAKVLPYGNSDQGELLQYARLALANDSGPIRQAVNEFANGPGAKEEKFSVVDFVPHDSERKRGTVSATAVGGQKLLVSFGAPQVIGGLCSLSQEQARLLERDVEAAAESGYRAMSLAANFGSFEESQMKLLGTFLFSDELRPDSAASLAFMERHGIATKMVTGDHHAIARRVAAELAMSGRTLSKAELSALDLPNLPAAEFDRLAAFAEVLPQDKYELVEYAKRRFVVAVTGDGVNDIPAVEAADVGIAVEGAVDALKSSADMVIVQGGISVIENALLEARRIFVRLTTFAMYRISESLRVIFDILVIGLWYKDFPLLPIQLIILALLNDIPIISLAFNRVDIPRLPPKPDSRRKFVLGSLFGSAGLLNSVLFFVLLYSGWHADWASLQTMFFLKLSVSGHLLIFVAHTAKRWWKYLPSPAVALATLGTQVLATAFAYFGLFMKAISWEQIVFTWLWALVWMQVSELIKAGQQAYQRRTLAKAKA